MQMSQEAITDLLETELYTARNSLSYLCREKLGYKDISLFHDEVQSVLDSKEKRKLFLLPRGHLKSSFITIGGSIRAILRNPDVRILIDNAVWENSRSFLRSIREHLLSPELQEINPCELTTDNSEQITISTRRMKHLKEPTVDTTGAERTKTSQHYDLIIADDLVARENIGTREQIEKIITHYKDLLDLLEPNGELWIIGTRWHYADLYGTIIDGNDSRPDSHKFLILIKDAEVGIDGNPLFPEKFTWDHLQSLRNEKGSYEYSCQYKNNPVDPETAQFKLSDFRWFDELPSNITHFVAFDPAFSEKTQADYTAGVAIATDDKQPFNIYVDFYVRDHLTASQVIDNVYSFRDRFDPIAMGIESNAAQKVLYEFIYKDPRINKGIPILEIKPDQDKFRRILKLQPFVENHRVFFRRSQKELIDELLRFPKGEHDDLIDALAMAVKLATETPEIENKKPKAWTEEWFERQERRQGGDDDNE